MRIDYEIKQVVPRIEWLYFFHAWGVKEGQKAAEALRDDAMRLLDEWSGKVRTHALLVTEDCHSEGDDIVLASGVHIPLLRQQQARAGEPYLCLSDFINPRGDKIGIFCCTCDADCTGDDYTGLLRQTVADRLAEATAELLQSSSGIRPAVGYPSLPDQSIIFVLDKVLDFSQIGVSLTENGAMRPHASVSGLIINHPAAHYFSVGPVGEDQLQDYALRRGTDKEALRKFFKT